MSRFEKCEAVDEEVVDAEVDLAAVPAVLLKVPPVALLMAVRVVLHQLIRKREVVLGSSHWRA